MDYNELNLSQKKQLLFAKPVYVKRGEAKFNINAEYLKWNSGWFRECDRELYVSLLPMLPLLEKNVPLDEADYILYSHQYARVEDMSPIVIKQLEEIDRIRRPDAEIIVVGKASNVEALLAGSIQNITFWPNHYAELVGKKFGIESIKDEYFVYDAEEKVLNIWPVNGCLRKCKFCRRTYMDIPFESLSLEYIKTKLDWYKENCPEKLQAIRFRAENLTEYGLDLPGRPTLADLFDLVSSYDEVEYIMVSIGLAICEFTDAMVDAVCRSGKFYHLALNLEAGSNTLLQTIGKDHTVERALHITTKIRQAIPDIILTTTVMVGLPTETLADVHALADLCIATTMNDILINLYGSAPKYPLNDLPQLSPQLREYHLRLLVKLIKQKKRQSLNKDLLTLTYNKKFKRGSRTELRAQEYSREMLEDWCLLIWQRSNSIFIPWRNYFIKQTKEIDELIPYIRQRYLDSQAAANVH